MVVDWYSITTRVLENLWIGFLEFIPRIIGALIVFIVGWFIAIGIGKLVTEILRRLQFNQLFSKGGWGKALSKAEIDVDASGFIGDIFKWVLVIVFLLAAVEILGFTEFAGFVKSVLGYLPNVVVASAIFVAAVIIANIAEKVVVAAVEGIRVGYSELIGVIVRWSIWVFAILAILSQLKVATTLVHTLFQGIVGVIVISLGLAFGLGGKEVARDMLEDFRGKLRKR